jgi:hypothetical protein
MVRELETLACENHEEYTRLQALHNTIRDSKDTLLNTGAVLRVSGGVLLSTITVISTSIIQSYLQRLL